MKRNETLKKNLMKIMWFACCLIMVFPFALSVSNCSQGDDDDDSNESQEPAYIANFREAVFITFQAHLYAMSETRPGLVEQDIKDMIDMVFAQEGAHGPAFPHIVASGENTLVAHYEGGDGVLDEGEPLLIDIGAFYNNHSADVTRFYPVNGEFSARQRELYQLVLDALLLVETSAQPGIDSLNDLRQRVREFFRASNLRANDQNGDPQTMDHFFLYALGHYIGYNVHGEDTGWDSSLPLQEWQIIALEPGLYIPSETIGVRVEDDYIVTNTGLERVSTTVPRTIEDIEAMMATSSKNHDEELVIAS